MYVLEIAFSKAWEKETGGKGGEEGLLNRRRIDLFGIQLWKLTLI